MASCPNCGFDLTETGVCTVCGYGKKGDQPVKTNAKKQSRVVWIALSAALAVVVIAGIVYFSATARAARPAAAVASAPRASAPAPAANAGSRT